MTRKPVVPGRGGARLGVALEPRPELDGRQEARPKSRSLAADCRYRYYYHDEYYFASIMSIVISTITTTIIIISATTATTIITTADC